VVVNDAIVLIVAINERLRQGMPLFDAFREGGKRRFRAIVLTSLTTFAGLFPMLLEKSFQAQVLIPMALSIAFGVLFATIGTLLIIPCLLAVLNDLRCLLYGMWHLRWPPTRESVEPSCNLGKL
jgi:multidrug efflux pump subunit AcrB